MGGNLAHRHVHTPFDSMPYYVVDSIETPNPP